MKSLLLGTVMAVTLGIAAASAQSTAAPASAPNAANPATKAEATADSAATPSFIDKQEAGLFRAPKLIGVAVYDSNNKSVGKIDDILLDHNGDAKVVVIGVGGFLGIGRKDVGLPYSSIHWQTEQRTVATGAPPAGGTMGGTDAPSDKTVQKTVNPAQEEAYHGYPDRAVVQLSQAQLKSAPDFKYATDPTATMAPAAENVPATPAQTPAQKP